MEHLRLAVILVVPLLAAFAPVQMSGAPPLLNQFQITSQSMYGTSTYTIFYYVPPRVQTGSNLTITASLLVSQLTGVELHVADYQLTAVVDLGPGHILLGSVNVSGAAQKWLYPGARWGPVNISLPLTQQNTGVTPGHTVRGNMTIALFTHVLIDLPSLVLQPDSGQGSAGYVYVETASGGGLEAATFAPPLLIGSGAVLLILRVLIFRDEKRRSQ